MIHNFRNLSVLVVEDTDAMRRLIISLLKTLGVNKVSFARDGEEAFTHFCRQPVDVILTDWLMKPMSGIDLIKKVRHDKASPNKIVPIIIVTGYSARQRVSEARDVGVTEFLVKPFTAEDLSSRLAHVINRPRDFIQNPEFFGPDRRRRKMDNYEGPQRRSVDRPAAQAGKSSTNEWEVEL